MKTAQTLNRGLNPISIPDIIELKCGIQFPKKNLASLTFLKFTIIKILLQKIINNINTSLYGNAKMQDQTLQCNGDQFVTYLCTITEMITAINQSIYFTI